MHLPTFIKNFLKQARLVEELKSLRGREGDGLQAIAECHQDSLDNRLPAQERNLFAFVCRMIPIICHLTPREVRQRRESVEPFARFLNSRRQTRF